MLDLKKLSKTDPVKRDVEKGLEDVEHSPMDPPTAYSNSTVKRVTPEEMEKPLRDLVDEHKEVLRQVDDFEKALVQFKMNGYKLDKKINEVFGEFFKFFDNHLLPHNQKEEKALFPLLHKKLLAAGEHSTGDQPMTAINIMEDDHVKFIQLGALAFNLLGMAMRIQDDNARTFVFDTAYENGRELIEMLKLHVYREDVTLFPLAHKLITSEEFAEIDKEMQAIH